MARASEIFASLDLRDAGAVVDALNRGATTNRAAACRRGAVDVARVGAGEDKFPAVARLARGYAEATAGGPADYPRLIATGDLHDNPLYLMRLCTAAGMDAEDGGDAMHLTLHELIHGERLVNGMDFSYRVLARVAALKAQWPERVHTLLANHELAQAMGQQVAKDGVRNNQAFDAALDVTFGARAEEVRGAVKAFVLSMPLALRVERDGMPAVLCAHSLPSPEVMERFDTGVLERELMEADYVARRGSAHLMVWGRGHTPEMIEALAHRWDVGLFILGHEKAPEGALVVSPKCVVLNSDHERGVYADVDVRSVREAGEVVAGTRRLG